MMNYTGISFPIRLNTRGGIALSTTNTFSNKHIEEGIYQILSTCNFERVMENQAGSSLSRHLLESQDTALYDIIKYEVIKTLQEQEDRITIDEQNTMIYGDENRVFVELHYTINIYNDKTYISNIQL